jgi:YD repeat-containing protein
MKKVALVAGLILVGLVSWKARGLADSRISAQISYDGTGRPISITDSGGRSVHLTYCSDDRARACEVRWSAH